MLGLKAHKTIAAFGGASLGAGKSPRRVARLGESIHTWYTKFKSTQPSEAAAQPITKSGLELHVHLQISGEQT